MAAVSAPDPPARVAVVGAGLAGWRTVVELRAAGYAGEVALLGAEPLPPYDRPPLSKAVLSTPAGVPPPDTTLDADWAALGVVPRLGVAATGLVGTRVLTDVGDVGADAVVVATGAEPIRLPGDPRQRVLRTRADALGLRAALVPGRRVVVVGAGWIGAEVATAAAGRRCRVLVLEAGAAPLGGALPAEVGRLTLPWYAAAGIEVRLHTAVEAVEPGGVVVAGERVAADVVVVAVGVRPATAWCGPLVVGTDLRVEGRPGVWAVGDAALRRSVRYARVVRGEHWDDALHAPEVLARNLVGGGAEAYDPVPYVWSDQLGRTLQWCGVAHGLLVLRGRPSEPAFSCAWLGADGALAGLLAVGRPRDLLQGRRLAAARTPLDPARVADPGVALRDAAR